MAAHPVHTHARTHARAATHHTLHHNRTSHTARAQERRLRIWHPFWDGLILTRTEFALPEMRKGEQLSYAESTAYPPYLQNFRGTVAERHLENKEIAASVGLEEYRRGVSVQPRPVQVRFCGPRPSPSIAAVLVC